MPNNQAPTAHLSDAELLGVVVSTESKEQSALDVGAMLLGHFGGLRQLSRATDADIAHISHLQPSQTATLAALAELLRRVQRATEQPRPQIQTAADVVDLLGAEMEGLKQEELRAVLLDSHRRVMASPTLYIGSLHMTVIRMAEIFRDAIARNAASLVLVHNHPSGDPTPSPQDLSMTQDAIQAGKLLDIAILDHVIIGHGRWVSLRDTGVAF